MKKITKLQLYHIVCVFLIILSLALSFLVFLPCCIRALQGVKDVINSVGYLCSGKVKATVMKIPGGMDTVLPLTVAEFKAVCTQTGKNFINTTYIKAFLIDLIFFAVFTGITLTIIAVIIAVVVVCIKVKYKKINTNHNYNTLALRFWFTLEDIIYYPVKCFILNVWDFAKIYKAYVIVFCCVWTLNFNLLTVALETIAFVLYFIRSMDFANIFIQIAKLAVDISVILRYMPLPIWFTVAYKIFHYFRKEKGFAILELEEEITSEVLDNHPGDMLATGKPRVGKTFLITYLQKLQAKMFRRKAKEKSFERRMEFPYFPWVLVEQTIMEMREKIPTFNLHKLHTFLDELEALFKQRNELNPNIYRVKLEKYQALGYQGHDFCFDYNYQRFGMEFDNNAQIVQLFDCIHLYAEHFYRYSAKTSGIFNNYPVRDYIRWEYYGNYPLLDEENNELRVTTEELYAYSQLSHRYYFDMGRFGKKKNKKGFYNYNFEGGVIGIAEAGKEYGNQISNKEYSKDKKDKEEGKTECTPLNDKAAMQLKMEGHSATVDGVTYKRRYMDEQRPSSLQGDMLETLTEMRVLRRGEAVIKLPHFKLEEWLYWYSREKMERILDYMLPRHGENSLLMYWAYRIYSIIHNHYVRIYNQFSSREMQVKFIDHSSGEMIGESSIETMYVPSRPMACAYETGYFACVYKAMRKRSKAGGNDQVPTYKTLEPNIEEMRSVGSHFYDTVLKMMDEEENDVDLWTEDKSFAVILPTRIWGTGE